MKLILHLKVRLNIVVIEMYYCREELFLYLLLVIGGGKCIGNCSYNNDITRDHNGKKIIF